jgi:LacI family transcriptional regulator
VSALQHGDHQGRATLRTVAHRAGVHVSTVSRVLNTPADAPQRVASATASRIRAIAAEVGYVPNPHATGLRTQRSHLLGVLVPRLSDLVLATIYEGVEQEAASRGYQAFVANSYDDERERARRTEMFLARRVDGLILGDAPYDARFVDGLADRGVPFVLVNRRAADHPSVTCDDRTGGRLAAEHLLALGHTRPAVLAGQPYASTGIDRTEGFAERYAEAGLPVEAERVVHCGFDVEGGRQGMERLLAAGGPPRAVFVVNDFAALGAYGALRAAGLLPGRDVAVVGFNDVPLAAVLPIPLTSVRSPMLRMGQRGVQLLLDLLAGQRVESELLEPELVARESTLGTAG